MSQPPPADPALALYLAERDIPCPNPACGFNLRGLAGSACPECGHELQIGLRGPGELFRVRVWVYALALSTTVVSLLCFGFTVTNGLWRGFGRNDGGVAALFYTWSVASTAYCISIWGAFVTRAICRPAFPLSWLFVLFAGAVVVQQALIFLFMLFMIHMHR
ncbi:MAG: hypothetical protein HUU18_06620 [Phycisphaerales bacterium]|nr:hypothetical protein [Phycisphaerales bacterium]